MAAPVTELFNPGGKTRSKVWKVFGFAKIKEGPPTKSNLDMTKAICKLCRKAYANKGNTTNLMFHINNEHKEVDCEVEGQGQKPKPTLQTFITGSAGLTMSRLSTKKTEEITHELLKLVVMKALPLSLVDQHHFKEFVKLLDSRYNIPSRKVLQQTLSKTKAEVAMTIKKELDGINDVSITHDGWTSIQTQSFHTVTAHYIDSEWELKTVVLETTKSEGSQTGENIAEALLSTKEKWNLKNITAVTDNAANERKAFEILKWDRFGCFGHRLNLIVKKALSVTEVSRLLGKGRKLVSHFHMSSTSVDMLLKKQKLLLEGPAVGHRLIADVATRWNSSLNLLERLLEQTPAIVALGNDQTASKTLQDVVKRCSFSFEEQCLAEELVKVLKPFEKATVILSADQNPTLQKVLPIILKLEHVLVEKDDDKECMKKVKEIMRDQLESRTQDKETIHMACMLNPSTKDLEFLQVVDKEKVHNLFKEKVRNIVVEGSPSTVKVKTEKPDDYLPLPEPELPKLPDSTQEIPDVLESVSADHEPPEKKIKVNNAMVDEWFDDLVIVGESRSPIEEKVEEEISRYLKYSVNDDDKSLTLLKWWERNHPFYPHISSLARKYLAIPASSVSSERIFSLAGQLVNKKRARLSPQNLDLMIFLNKNTSYW